MQIKRLKILKTITITITIAITCIPLLTSCSGWFKPKTMTIEYDEEVKLHDGSMIWVHITRHYFYTSEPAHGGAYMPSKVEISWDTGFEGVGRKSVFFNDQMSLIDKFNDVWYVAGAKNNGAPKMLNDSINCNSIGFFVGDNGCVVSIDKQGAFIKKDPKDLNNPKVNILY